MSKRECTSVSIIKDPINLRTLESQGPDAFTLITRSHPITSDIKEGGRSSFSPLAVECVSLVSSVGVRNLLVCL